MPSKRGLAPGTVARWTGTIIVILVLGAGSPPTGEAVPPAPSEYEVKAAFLYNMMKFIEWPAPGVPSGETIDLCMLGTVPDHEPFDQLRGQEVLGKKLQVTYLSDLAEADSCSALFIGASEERRLPAIVSALAGVPVLTFGDSQDFARRGVMINFYIERQKVRFEINMESAQRAGIKMSAKLLRLAGTVYGAVPAGE